MPPTGSCCRNSAVCRARRSREEAAQSETRLLLRTDNARCRDVYARLSSKLSTMPAETETAFCGSVFSSAARRAIGFDEFEAVEVVEPNETPLNDPDRTDANPALLSAEKSDAARL